MATLPATLKLYLKLAVDRRQILARHLATRIGIGVLAAMILLTGLALLNVALFLALRPYLGDLWSVLAVAVLHIAVGAAAAAYALSEPSSAELRALAEAEAAALGALDSESHDALASLLAAEQRIEQIGFRLATTAGAIPGLIRLLNRPAKSSTAPDTAIKVPGDKT